MVKGGEKLKRGRPAFKVTAEMVTEARRLLGVLVYESTVAGRLCEKYGFGRKAAHKCIALAKAETRAALAASGADALMSSYMGLVAIAANEATADKVKVLAWGQVIRLLGLQKLFKEVESADEVERFLREVGLRRQARESPASATDTVPATKAVTE